MDIRLATTADVPGVLPMVDKLGALMESFDAAAYSRVANFAERYRPWLVAQAEQATSVFIVAEREGKLVAFLIGVTEREIPIYRVERFGFICDVWVEEAYRNEGIARQMVMLAIERFKTIGVSQVRLDTAVPNEAARSLYSSCGFRPTTVSMLLEISP